MLLRKKKNLSQAALGKLIGTSGDIIGRYERNNMSPSIDVIIKLSDALGVSIDYLVGKTNVELDQKSINRIKAIQKLSAEDQQHIYAMVDAFLFKSNVKQQME